MSLLNSLDEIPSSKLIEELKRRQRLRSCFKCPYCSKPLQMKIVDKIIIGCEPAVGCEYEITCSCRFSDTDAYHPIDCLAGLSNG